MRLAILTDLHGVLEPCGCTRSSAGGADRIAALLSALRQRDPALGFILAGDSLFPSAAAAGERANSEAQAQLKADAWVELLRRMKLDAIAPGPRDFARGASALISLSRQSKGALLGTETPIEGLDRLANQAVLRVGMRRVALVVDDRRSPAADLTIAFSHGEQWEEEPKEKPNISEPSLHWRPRRFGGSSIPARHADVVIHSGLMPPRSFARVRDGVVHVSAGQDGEQLLVLELWPRAGPGAPWQLVASAPSADTVNAARVEHIRLAQDKPRDLEVRRLLDQQFARINAHNRELAVTSVALKTKPHGGREPPAFMGARTCAACHTGAYFAWRETPHARAYQTLVTRGRELDLDCIGCHLTGFEQPRGAAIGHLEELRGVGCESCHGPGEAHADNPRVRQRNVQRAVPDAACRVCHDLAHSDDFNYEEKRQRLLTPGHGLAHPGGSRPD